MLAHSRCPHRSRPRSRRAHTRSARHEARAARARYGHARTLKYGFDKALEATPYRLAPRGDHRVETREPPTHEAMLTLLTRGESSGGEGGSRFISFGGVLSFIFADLIILPILDIYRRYYGWRMA